MSDNEIKKYDKKIPRKEIRSKSHKIAKTIYNLKWFKKLRNRFRQKIDKPIFIKKE